MTSGYRQQDHRDDIPISRHSHLDKCYRHGRYGGKISSDLKQNITLEHKIIHMLNLPHEDIHIKFKQI